MADNDQERTEQPTSRKREEAWKEGNFAVSREVSSFFVLLGAVVVLYFASMWLFTGTAELMKGAFSSFGDELDADGVVRLARESSWKFLYIIMPLFLIPLAGAVSYVLQNGFSFTTKKLEPDFTKLDPATGLKRLISLNSAAELVKSLLKISVITCVVYAAVSKESVRIPMLMGADAWSTLTYMATVTFSIMTKTIWVLAVIAAMDYLYARWQFEKGLRMTKEEIKEEMKETEGDPMVKARIRSIQRELARKRMMQDVPKADFVLTNPTHIAVAIRYDKTKAPAPVVVAKGAGFVAEKIREIAARHGVPVLENKPLARSLYKLVEVGSEIPVSMYKAVAGILAHVYRLKGKIRH